MDLEVASKPVSLAQGHSEQSAVFESVGLLLTELICCVLPSESWVPAPGGCGMMLWVSLQEAFGLVSSSRGNLAYVSLGISEGREGSKSLHGYGSYYDEGRVGCPIRSLSHIYLEDQEDN